MKEYHLLANCGHVHRCMHSLYTSQEEVSTGSPTVLLGHDALLTKQDSALQQLCNQLWILQGFSQSIEADLLQLLVILDLL